jgi:hypothetical protein
MVSQAYFVNIEAQLLKELDQANESIVVSVTWFTNGPLLNKLCEKCGRGVSVELMVLDDEINNAAAINLPRLRAAGGKLYMIPKDKGGEVMHNKYCVIDRSTVINGSYNWSYKARQNHESITVSSDATALAQQFKKEFRRLKTKYFAKEEAQAQPSDSGQVLKRISLIKHLIELDELEDLPLHLAKLEGLGLDVELDVIINSLRERRYGTALPRIEQYIKTHNRITIFVDPEVDGLRMEAKALELQLAALESEKTELERMLNQFHIRHTQELGPLIIKILRLKEERSSTEEERLEAEDARQDYEKGYAQRKEEVVFTLTPNEKEDLKQLYRQASKMCHPDMVAAEHQQEAAKWFVALKDAYEHNDVKKVQEIMDRLRSGTAFGSVVESLSELERLRSWVEEYRLRVSDLLEELMAIKDSEEYRAISSIADWDAYFLSMKKELMEELEQLIHDQA